MARFDSAIALAKKLITKNGQTVTLRTFTPVEGTDPNKPWKPGGQGPHGPDARGRVSGL
jgi:hypothetical protein